MSGAASELGLIYRCSLHSKRLFAGKSLQAVLIKINISHISLDSHVPYIEIM